MYGVKTDRQTDRPSVCSLSRCRHTVTALFCQTDFVLFGAFGISQSGAPVSLEERCSHHRSLSLHRVWWWNTRAPAALAEWPDEWGLTKPWDRSPRSLSIEASSSLIYSCPAAADESQQHAGWGAETSAPASTTRYCDLAAGGARKFFRIKWILKNKLRTTAVTCFDFTGTNNLA